LKVNNMAAMRNSKTNVSLGQHRLLPLVVVLALLVMQNSSLKHSQDGDLSTNYDCDYCLQISSSGDGITAECGYILPKVSIVSYSPQTECKFVSQRTSPALEPSSVGQFDFVILSHLRFSLSEFLN